MKYIMNGIRMNSKSVKSAICNICKSRCYLYSGTDKLCTHGKRGNRCPGACTNQHSAIILGTIRFQKECNYRKITGRELEEHQNLKRFVKCPGPHISWKARWKLKTGIQPR